MDKKWYERVARLRYSDGKWLEAEDDSVCVRGDFTGKFSEGLKELRYTASEAVEIFNHYSKPASHITLLVLEQEVDYSLNGLMLLRHSSQIKLLRKVPYLTMELTENAGFPTQSHKKARFLAREDDMGTLVWCTEEGHVWEHEQLIKCTLKELVKYS
ncbi:MAG: hypothetical protein OXC44_01140 [Proteobacteria bacterium]|nr:hypothetical protein [Pseudomonadota bacterium]